MVESMSDDIKKYYETYDYGSRTPVKIPLDQLNEIEKDLHATFSKYINFLSIIS